MILQDPGKSPDRRSKISNDVVQKICFLQVHPKRPIPNGESAFQCVGQGRATSTHVREVCRREFPCTSEEDSDIEKEVQGCIVGLQPRSAQTTSAEKDSL